MSKRPRTQPPTELTREQAAVLRSDARRIVLSASAGCGKTRVMSDAYLSRLRADPCPMPGQMVALTFTRKAARELRERVTAEFRGVLTSRDADSSLPDSRWDYGDPSIHTFHDYCGLLLRRYSEPGSDASSFSLLDEPVAHALRDEALRQSMLSWFASKREDFLQIAAIYGISKLKEQLAAVMRLGLLWESSDSEDSNGDARFERWNQAWERHVLPSIRANLLRVGRHCVDVMVNNPCNAPSMSKKVERLRAIFEACGSDGPTREQIAELPSLLNRTGTRPTHWSTPEQQAAFVSACEAFKQAVESYSSAGSIDVALSREMARRSRVLEVLGQDALRAYGALKRERGCFDFDDLQLHALQMLSDDSNRVLDRLRGTIQNLFVDEYQDTDPVQAAIVRLLAPSDGPGPRLLVVGDIKQSIYGFRNARPKLFQELREEVGITGRLDLTENFRSTPELINFFNALFVDVFNRDRTPLVARRASRPMTSCQSVELIEANSASSQGKDDVTQRRQREAAAIAHHVRRRLDSGLTIFDTAIGKWRNARPGDVTFLFRTMNPSEAYQTALEGLGFETYVVGGRAFYSRQEIIDACNLFRSVEDPFDEIALAGVLRAPCFGVSDDGLYWLGTSRFGTLSDGLIHRDEIADLARQDRARVDRAARLLESWRAIKDRMPLGCVVDRILAESGMEAAALISRNGAQAHANLRKLAKSARDLDEQGGFSLAEFVERLKANIDEPPSTEQAHVHEEFGDAIRLMTIHQAKGLEFPIVVLPDLDTHGRSSIEPVPFHDMTGPVARIADSIDAQEWQPGASKSDSKSTGHLGEVVQRFFQEQDQRDEALRLFYVAVTRARDHLILSTASSPSAGPEAHPTRLLFERFDRASGTCAQELPPDWPVPRMEVIDQSADEALAPPDPRKRDHRGTQRSDSEMIRELREGLNAGPHADAAQTSTDAR